MKIGYFLSSEEFGPRDLVDQARQAQAAGMHALWISDHFHPWNDEQGHSGFVWSVIGAIAQATDLHVTTAVTCPTIRIHPAIIAHAAATCAVLGEGRFSLGVGTGEALNEHILGDAWPEAQERRDMLEEAIEVIRLLWEGGQQTHRGEYYDVSTARIYDLPETPPAIIVSGFGPLAVDLAARVGDGFATVTPDAEGISRYRDGGGKGAVQAGVKLCYGPDEEAARATAYRLWPNEALPGELAQILPTPAHFEQASELVTPDLLETTVGPDVDAHLEAIQAYADAGVDELYVQQIGPDQEVFFRELAPKLLERFG